MIGCFNASHYSTWYRVQVRRPRWCYPTASLILNYLQIDHVDVVVRMTCCSLPPAKLREPLSASDNEM